LPRRYPTHHHATLVNVQQNHFWFILGLLGRLPLNFVVVKQLTGRAARELHRQLVTDPLRAIPFTQEAVDELPQHRVDGEPCRFGPQPAGRREPVSSVRQVPAIGRVAVTPQFPADRRHGPTQFLGDKPQAFPDPVQVRDPYPFLF